jgi:hypothetical protein
MDQSKPFVAHVPPAAVFLDYENIVYHLMQVYCHPPQISNIVNSVLKSLQVYLKDTMQLEVVIFKAYADFERQVSALGALYLLGIDTHNVLGKDHKNAADMKLCIDLMEVLYTRPDIQHFVLITGDRDYIPVVQHLRRLGRKIKAVAFKPTLSADLLQILGEENLIDASAFVDKYDTRHLVSERKSNLPPINLKIVGKIDLPDDPKGNARRAAGVKKF